ncbi:CADD family putative folate metabolism protein [Thermocoleostomius sinensis]|jgi:pyrroloquinoline-quinone synthase|uniref:CADD family putative folate metabolism protein n=1 Tax=Thermocoleostomius sinensis A174 TaxID=2016057 RepID=A0A9E8ZG08_9CYAN|nr:CADD family putative folate metabolism protein [Thermocoleostomius sinensis]WAL61154.1 CADD family putative folate metabolism protein [Thermocoleostomius sinensis A174]
MSLRQTLEAIVAQKHLLTHPFYVAWTEGKLDRDHLKEYAKQYFHHVLAFPTYISAIHYNTPHLAVRQELLENLIGEERGEKNHPALWRNFALALGATEAELETGPLLDTTANLIETFRDRCLNSPFYAGLAALYAYESQVPEVAKVKIEGLQQFYGMSNPTDYEFFTVHQEADVYHTEATVQLIEAHATTEAQQAEAAAVAQAAVDALWSFLDGIYETYCQDVKAEAIAV